MELISVVIPVFNTEKYVNKCVNSFISQTYKNIEIILVDDGSTDSSSEICDNFKKQDSRIKVIHKKNGGLSDARNAGIKESKGKYITFFDSDDYVDADYISYLYALIKENGSQISSCAYSVVNEKEEVLFSIAGKNDECIDKEEFLKKMLNEDGITVSACFKLYEKKMLDNILFPYGKICEDNGTTYKIIEKTNKKIAYGCTPKGYYVMRNGSITNSKFNLRKLDMIELTDEMCDFLSKRHPNLNDYITRRRIYARFNILRQLNPKDKETKELKNSLISYILKNKKFIIFNKIVPVRDKIACTLLIINKRLFFYCWKIYKEIKYENK